MNLAVVYMVAGMSSRFGGEIKQFAKIGPEGETLIEYSIKQALAAGFNQIVFIVGEKTEKPFKKKFGDEYQGVPVYYAFQQFDHDSREKPWGTTDALCTIDGVVNSGFVICNGDDIYGEDAFGLLADHLKSNSTNATIGYKIKNVLSETGGVNRGKFEIDSNKKMLSIQETFDIQKSNLAEKDLTEDSLCSMNIWAFQPEIIGLLGKILKDFKADHQGSSKIECLLPNTIGELIDSGQAVVDVYPTDETCFGVTSPEDEERVKNMIKNQS